MEIPANVVTAVRQANREREANKPRRAPVALRWREREQDNVTTKWTYKRNYKATYKIQHGNVTGYEIHEVYQRETNPRPVLIVKDLERVLESNVRMRCETIIRTLAKGYDLRLTGIEIQKGTFYQENIRFIPYESQPEETKTA